MSELTKSIVGLTNQRYYGQTSSMRIAVAKMVYRVALGSNMPINQPIDQKTYNRLHNQAQRFLLNAREMFKDWKPVEPLLGKTSSPQPPVPTALTLSRFDLSLRTAEMDLGSLSLLQELADGRPSCFEHLVADRLAKKQTSTLSLDIKGELLAYALAYGATHTEIIDASARFRDPKGPVTRTIIGDEDAFAAEREVWRLSLTAGKRLAARLDAFLHAAGWEIPS